MRASIGTCARRRASTHACLDRLGSEFFKALAVLMLQHLFEVLLAIEQQQVGRDQKDEAGRDQRLAQ